MMLKRWKKIDQTIKRVQKRKAEIDLDGHVDKKQRTLIGPQPKPNGWVERNNEDDVIDKIDNNFEEYSEEYNENNEMEEVPMEEPMDDIDSEEQAELLAMGELLLKPSGKQYLLDKSINKHSYDDNKVDLPRWFVEDEDKHNKPNIPVTKDMIMEYKRQLKSINARSSKKVIEAKARKKNILWIN